MSKKPIGVFDSGLGGLISVLPNENIVYFGDTGRVPYGNRSRETILEYTRQDFAFLRSKDVKCVIAACGTVSSVASNFGDNFDIPFTGVLLPTASSAIKATNNKKIGVIGTTATINSNSYKKQIQSLRPDIEVFSTDCPLFVPLVENGLICEDDFVVLEIAKRYLDTLKSKDIDTLILGCTHYPILKKVISKVMGANVTLIDSGYETALYTAHLLKENNLLNKDNKLGNCNFYVSDTTEGFSKLASIFLEKEISKSVNRVDINKF